MSEMLKAIVSSVLGLFKEEFDVRRLLLLPAVVIILIVALLVLDSVTGFLFFINMERKVAILNELHSLAQDGITQDPELSPIFQKMVAELAAYKPVSLSIPRISAITEIPGLEDFLKFLSGAFLPLAVAVDAYFRREQRKEEWKHTVVGGLVLALVFGFIGILLPTFYRPWVNYLGYPILQVVLILGITKLTKK